MGRVSAMITADKDEAKGILSDLNAHFLECPFPEETASLCDDLLQTVVDANFPGALVPVFAPDGYLNINVAAGSVADWRRLKPILQAFAGPTITSFSGGTEELINGTPVSLIMMTSKPAVTTVIRLPIDEKMQIGALRALNASRLTLRRAPDLQKSSPVPTSWLLAKFQDQLNLGRRDGAWELLERLRSEFRLDALNLKFLEVQCHSAFDDWPEILSIPEFSSLCVARRTPALTSMLLEALYQVHLSALFERQDEEAVKAAYESKVRALAHPMLISPLPRGITSGGCRIYALEALLDGGREDIVHDLHERPEALSWLNRVAEAPLGSPPHMIKMAPVDMARGALLEADQLDETDRLASARHALSGLSLDELGQLREAFPFAPIMAAIEPLKEEFFPTSWEEWLALSKQAGFLDALNVARRGKDEWPINATASDPVAVKSLVSALNNAQQDPLSTQRTFQALPYLVAWLQKDRQFPSSSFAPVYASLLTLFAMENVRSPVIYGSSQILISALLTSGLDKKGYDDLIADVEEIAGDGFGVDMIYWLLDVIEAFMHSPAPSADSREAFLHRILARISPIWGRLTSMQRVAVELLSEELGWQFVPARATSPATSDGFSSKLESLRIAIYSLTESSGRHAKTALETLTPSVMVDTNADHHGTQRLRALAENSDLFVMTWLSAKHAATDFIREHRGSRPLLYAPGKGFSSIIRTIEDHLKSSNFRGKL